MTAMNAPVLPATHAERRVSRSRIGIVATLIVSLLATAGTRFYAEGLQNATASGGYATAASSTGNSLSGLDSFALALLLGGLRGPLVMILWTSSETQKSEKNLEDFDTKVEWIRLLQPEFDTVHIFQIWNKAYNISVQMATLSNKYTVILDALDYANKIDRDRPDDINILTAIAQVFFDKFGNSQEKAYYRKRYREETLPHKVAERLSRDNPAWRRLHADALLDENFHILPQYLVAARPRPADLAKDAEWEDGSSLQYLKQYEPYPYGIAPFAIAYDYYKRAQVLQDVAHQKHLQMSEMVIDSRPALSIRAWAEEEWQDGREAELQAFAPPDQFKNFEPPTERVDEEQPTAAIALDAKPNDQALVDRAIFQYERASRLATDAVAEYSRHLANPEYARSYDTYASHIEHVRGVELITKADAAYLRAMSATGDERAKLIAEAKDAYTKARSQFARTILKFFVDENFRRAQPGFGPKSTKATVDTLNDDQLARAIQGIDQLIAKVNKGQDGYHDDRNEYDQYIRRCSIRLQSLGK